MRSYEKIMSAVKAKGYKFFEAEGDINMIWERTSDIITNRFTDWLHVTYKENGIGKVLTIPSTTKPGIKGSTDSPITYEGITGTAIIIPGQYRKCDRFEDTYTGFSKYPFMRQIGPINYWRDGDRDQIVDHVQEQDNKIFGTHCHKMSPNGNYGSGLIDNWSLGCCGAPEPEWIKILPIIRKSIPLWGNIFTRTIMESIDFK